MENIIKRAVEGNYPNDWEEFKGKSPELCYYSSIVLDPLFWQALGKACGWGGIAPGIDVASIGSNFEPNWKRYGIKFHEINLTSGWSEAVEYLEGIIK